MPTPVWVMLIQSLAPLGVELTRELVSLVQREKAEGKPLVDADFDRLLSLYAGKTSEQALQEAIRRAGLPGPTALPTA